MPMNYAGVFMDESGRSLTIRRVTDTACPFRVRVNLSAALEQALRAHPAYPFEIAHELKGWMCSFEAAPGVLKIEAGQLRLDGAGPTLDLTPRSEDDLEPAVTMGLYDEWEDDLGLPWAWPLSPYHRRVP